MTRYDSSSLQAMAEESLVAFRFLADVGVTSGELHYISGRHATYFNGNTYTPVGAFGYIEPILEDDSDVPRDVVFGLCGVNTLSMIGSLSLFDPLQEHMLNRPVRFYRQFLDPNNLTAVHTPELFWPGRISDIDIDLKNGVFEVRASSDIRQNARMRFFNRETFRSIDSSDTFGDWIDAVPKFRGDWGGSEVTFAGQRYRTYTDRFGSVRVRES